MKFFKPSTKQQWLERLASQPQQFWLFTDFDGTLAPIVSDRDKAFIHPQSRAALSVLEQQVVIVTGRDLATLDKLANPNQDNAGANKPIQFTAIAEHGLVQRVREKQSSLLNKEHQAFMHYQQKKARDYIESLIRHEELPVSIDALLEINKSGSLAFHYRALEEAVAANTLTQAKLDQIKSTLRTYLEFELSSENNDKRTQYFDIIDGLMVYEMKYNAADKGTAIQQFLHQHDDQQAGSLLLFAGDDFAGTDGSAAAAVRGRGGLVIQVLDPNDEKSMAYDDSRFPERHPHLVLGSPAEFARLLQEISQIYSENPKKNHAVSNGDDTHTQAQGLSATSPC